MRLNRLFQADGRAGIAQFKRMAARFARLGLEVELQVRYHPRDRDDGDIAKWLRYVRSVVRAFGPNRAVTGLQITNEVNITYSKNTSDGFYKRAVEALVRGVIEAKRTSLRLGYRHQQIGFNYAFRSSGAALATDAAFWRAVGRRGGARLRRATDWVGLDIYPGHLHARPPPAGADRGLRRLLPRGPGPGARVLHAEGRLHALHAAAHRGDRLSHRSRAARSPPS